MVPSNMEILDSETSTRRSCCCGTGMVAGGKSLTLKPGRLTKSLLEGGIFSWIREVRQLRTES